MNGDVDFMCVLRLVSCVSAEHKHWMWWEDHDSAPGGVGPRPVITQRGDKLFSVCSVFIVRVTSRYVRRGFMEHSLLMAKN